MARSSICPVLEKISGLTIKQSSPNSFSSIPIEDHRVHQGILTVNGKKSDEDLIMDLELARAPVNSNIDWEKICHALSHLAPFQVLPNPDPEASQKSLWIRMLFINPWSDSITQRSFTAKIQKVKESAVDIQQHLKIQSQNDEQSRSQYGDPSIQFVEPLDTKSYALLNQSTLQSWFTTAIIYLLGDYHLLVAVRGPLSQQFVLAALQCYVLQFGRSMGELVIATRFWEKLDVPDILAINGSILSLTNPLTDLKTQKSVHKPVLIISDEIDSDNDKVITNLVFPQEKIPLVLLIEFGLQHFAYRIGGISLAEKQKLTKEITASLKKFGGQVAEGVLMALIKAKLSQLRYPTKQTPSTLQILFQFDHK